MAFRIVQPHPRYGNFQGHAMYGIKSLGFYSPRLRTAVEECASAATSSDARDKVFLSYVGEFEPCNYKGLRSELPALAADSRHCFIFVLFVYEQRNACSILHTRACCLREQGLIDFCFFVLFGMSDRLDIWIYNDRTHIQIRNGILFNVFAGSAAIFVINRWRIGRRIATDAVLSEAPIVGRRCGEARSG